MKARKATPPSRNRAAMLRMTDAEVLAAAQSDPDCPPLTLARLKRMRRVVKRPNGLYGPSKRS